MIPNLRIGLRGFWKRGKVIIITKSVIDFLVTEIPIEKTLRYHYAPMPSEVVNRKPEEQRSWVWYTIYMESTIKLNHDDRVTIGDKNFKIGKLSDWTQSGFLSYEAIEDFTDYPAVTT